jgi:hypothetical protein
VFWDCYWSWWGICQTEYLNSTSYSPFKDQYISSFTVISIIIILFWFVLLAFCITVHNLTAYTIANSTYTSSHCHIPYLYVCCSHCAKTAPSAYHCHTYWLANPHPIVLLPLSPTAELTDCWRSSLQILTQYFNFDQMLWICQILEKNDSKVVQHTRFLCTKWNLIIQLWGRFSMVCWLGVVYLCNKLGLLICVFREPVAKSIYANMSDKFAIKNDLKQRSGLLPFLSTLC